MPYLVTILYLQSSFDHHTNRQHTVPPLLHSGTRNSSIINKSHDTFMQYAMVWLTPKTRCSPYMLQRLLNWSFYTEGCKHKLRGTEKLGTAGAPPPWDWRRS